MVLMFLGTLIHDYVTPLISDGSNYNWLGPNNTPPNGKPSLPLPTKTNSVDNATNGVIMAAAMAGAYKLAQKSPSVAGKIGVVIGGIGAGATKNISNNLSIEIGKTKFISNGNLMDVLKDTLHLTGNNAIDLLNVIQFSQRLQLFLIFLISYNLLFSNLNIVKLEGFLARLLPAIIVRWYVKSLTIYQKSSFIILICLIFLLSICNYYSYYYLGFFFYWKPRSNSRILF
uniref:Uncharacterized protein n=1 Tax=Ganoderma leucocontextum TaxID=1566825 RepID=A0A2S1WBF8_9APHY|nr:hypothetical protein [Ganoderma leucocontextum]AWJ63923.1 hypothetical protein [Ganoderma leucocontextum]